MVIGVRRSGKSTLCFNVLKKAHVKFAYVNFDDENYVGYLYQAFLLKQLRKYSTKSSERIRNAKCYPIDVSLMNAGKDAFAKDNFGWTLQSLAYLALCRKYGIGYDIYYHKTDTYEVDFVVCLRATVGELVQVSYDTSSEKTHNRETSALVKAGSSLKCDKLTLVTAYDERVGCSRTSH